jgi:S1-C subfamily serine protease
MMPRSLLSALLTVAVAAPAFSQARIATTPRASIYSFDSADPDRAMLGVSTMSDGKRDTLGLLVTSVTEGSPAEKAGIEEGNRIASINGVSLKLARVDAGESDMGGVMTNRLTREMRKLKPGDEASLEVWGNGRYHTVKVKTVSAEDLIPARRTRISDEDRAMLGISLSSNGSKRDTLGVFVSGISEDGPADKAGITEGDRIASINGVDLRTPREDVGEGWASSSKVQRMQREIGKLKVGQSADLVVVSGGRSRTVKVTAGRVSDLKDYGHGFSYKFGDGMSTFNFNGLRESLQNIGPQIRMELDQEMPRAMEEMKRRATEDMPRAMDAMRRSLDKIRTEAPLIRTRVMRGMII